MPVNNHLWSVWQEIQMIRARWSVFKWHSHMKFIHLGLASPSPALRTDALRLRELMNGFKRDFQCQQCGTCCLQHPCILHPDDLPKIAEFLNLSIEETITRYLVWDCSGDIEGSGPVYCLTPKRKGDRGTLVSYLWASDARPCIFLDHHNNCKIHPVRPLGARQFNHYISEYEKMEAIADWQDHPYTHRYFHGMTQVPGTRNPIITFFYNIWRLAWYEVRDAEIKAFRESLKCPKESLIQDG